MKSKTCKGKQMWSFFLQINYGFPQKLVKAAHSVRFSPQDTCNYLEVVPENKKWSESG